MPALLGMMGPELITVYKASLAGQRIVSRSPYGADNSLFTHLLHSLLVAHSPGASGPWVFLPLLLWITARGRRSCWVTLASWTSTTLRNEQAAGLPVSCPGVQTLIPATSDMVYKSHTDAYDMFIDMSDVLSVLGNIDVRSLDKFQSPPPVLHCQPEVGKKPSTRVVTYSFADLGLYRSLVLLDQSPRGVRATTVGFTATNRSGGMWLVVFELLESMWHLCVGVCDFALGRGRVGIQLEDSEDARLLRDADVHSLLDNYDDEDDNIISAEADDGPIPDDTARRGRLILDQFHHNAYHLYARLISVSAGSWELTPAQLKELTGRWTGGNEEERQWLALARNWNVEPAIGSEHTEGANVSEQ